MDAVREDVQVVGVREEDTEKRMKWEAVIRRGNASTGTSVRRRRIINLNCPFLYYGLDFYFQTIISSKLLLRRFEATDLRSRFGCRGNSSEDVWLDGGMLECEHPELQIHSGMCVCVCVCSPPYPEDTRKLRNRSKQKAAFSPVQISAAAGRLRCCFRRFGDKHARLDRLQEETMCCIQSLRQGGGAATQLLLQPAASSSAASCCCSSQLLLTSSCTSSAHSAAAAAASCCCFLLLLLTTLELPCRRPNPTTTLMLRPEQQQQSSNACR